MNYFMIGFAVGMVVAILGAMIFYRVKRMGVLNIDDSDPEKTKYGIEITTDLDKLAEEKSCVLLIRKLPYDE